MFSNFVDDSLDPIRRSWTTLISVAVQSLAIGGLLLIPLLYPDVLPRLQLLGPEVIAPPPPPGPPPIGPRSSARPVAGNPASEPIVSPPNIPSSIVISNQPEISPAPTLPIGGPWVRGAGSSGDPNGILGSIGIAASPPPMPSPAPSARPPHVSHMMEGNLIYRVQPEYPALARQARIQGTVILRAEISREGKIQNLQLISGHPLLVQAAMDAVRRWRYRPYVLNDQPVEVETQITVNFTLFSGG
ncbi:MAG TPA: energy transducer TonB [Bryobacteraceae bacterium]|nr:energy transducer TonB [Bryobacteraceae bacterium]